MLKTDKNLLRLTKTHMERIKPVCDRVKCYENSVRNRLMKNAQDAKNRKQKKVKIKNKKHATKAKKSGPNKKYSNNGKTKFGSKNKKCTRRSHKKKRLASIEINSEHNESYPYQTTNTGSMMIEGLSPILSGEENLELSYDSISSDSFAEDEDEVDLRMKAKEITRKRSKHARSSEPAIELRVSPKELSTHNHYSSPTFRPAAENLRSTPSYAEDNATVFSSEMDVSIHSLPTVVMSPKVDSSLYSPTNSPIELVSFNKWHENISDDDVKTAVKIEPCDYECNDWFAMPCNLDAKVKTEVKLENKRF